MCRVRFIRWRCARRAGSATLGSAGPRLLLAAFGLFGVGCAVNDIDPTDRDPAVAIIGLEDAVGPPPARTDLFGPAPELPGFNDMLTLSEEQQRRFLVYFKSPRNADIAPHRRLVDYLEQRLAPVRYHDETLDAAEALRRGEGNCMSLTLVTAALSALAGVPSEWRLSRSRPVYSSDGTVIYSSNHIQTHLRDRSLRATPGRISLEPKVLVVDFFTDGRPVSGERVDPQQLAGLVFQNLAAEALARGELQRAYWLVQGGLEHDPRNAQLYNVLGVLHQRLGASDRAEDFYRYALDRFGDELIILRNLYYLLLAGERTQEAARIEQRIAGLPDPDPYPLLQLGDEALLAGDARRALRLYGEARRKAPHLHEVYGRIADVQLVLANPRAVRAALEQALATALRERDREIYRRRLDTVEGVRVDP
jgi:hypothetical protein